MQCPAKAASQRPPRKDRGTFGGTFSETFPQIQPRKDRGTFGGTLGRRDFTTPLRCGYIYHSATLSPFGDLRRALSQPRSRGGMRGAVSGKDQGRIFDSLQCSVFMGPLAQTNAQNTSLWEVNLPEGGHLAGLASHLVVDLQHGGVHNTILTTP